MMAPLRRTIQALLHLLALFMWVACSPLLFATLSVTHLLGRFRRKPSSLPQRPLHDGGSRPPCSIIIPNWNGKDLLERYLPTVVAACDFNLGDEVILVDNASTDGSAAWIAAHLPMVRILQLQTNQGFGGGSNRGVQAAVNPIVVLLNSDMRVEPDFLHPLLQPFIEADVFAVAAQILFTNPTKRREESGLTFAHLSAGRIQLGHHVDGIEDTLKPCFYPGGGSSAFNRDMLLELGGFDPIYHPFYLEDTDLGYEAWRRGWRVLFQPASIVYHEHRGTIGKHFNPDHIQRIVAKNRLLFQWKHLHSLAPLLQSGLAITTDLLYGIIREHIPPHRSPLGALFLALRQLPELLATRYRSSRAAIVSDTAALQLHQPDIYYDRFLARKSSGQKLRVLFVSPYPLYPAYHGGAVLITQSLAHLKSLCEVHLVVVLEDEGERLTHLPYAQDFASLHLLIRDKRHTAGRFGLAPFASREFDLPDLHRLLSTLIHDQRIDVIQLEYTQMAQYAGRYQNILTALFEHDVYFQTVGRRISTAGANAGIRTILEYLRAIRYELNALQRVDYIQVCTQDNARLLQTFLPGLDGRLDANLRAGIELPSYPPAFHGRQSDTLLFVGNFRHTPNREGLRWLIDAVMPLVLRTHPEVKLHIVGANCDQLAFPSPMPPWLVILGEVPQVLPHLHAHSVFVCPVLTGSGVRVKLLEAYAAGIPVVSTAIGAEGLHHHHGPLCRLGNTPEAFAAAIHATLTHPDESLVMAQRARRFVETHWDAAINAQNVERRYRELLHAKRHGSGNALKPVIVPTAATD
ncbi:MAG: glycosyltransferase [Bryobacterales bacterium]|jgi:GT2 family glycosyltransferase|nr:glycosyltransferase [Bryobacterales bacterium]